MASECPFGTNGKHIPRQLPAPICAHQTHWLWGPPDREPEVYIWLQWGRESLERGFRSVEQAGLAKAVARLRARFVIKDAEEDLKGAA